MGSKGSPLMTTKLPFSKGSSSRSEGYSDGRLIKRVDIDRLLILPYWDLGWAYDKKQSCLIRTDDRGLRFSENLKETDGFYTELSADALLLSDFLGMKFGMRC